MVDEICKVGRSQSSHPSLLDPIFFNVYQVFDELLLNISVTQSVFDVFDMFSFILLLVIVSLLVRRTIAASVLCCHGECVRQRRICLFFSPV
jgi:hypothetical protein